MENRENWFVEYFESSGTCFGLKVREKCHSEQSQYQKIEVYHTETFGHLLVLDGCTMVSERDHFIYHEMMTHPAMSLLPNAQNVAVIGGGDGGIVTELAKYSSVQSITQIELDERVTEVSKQFFPDITQALSDPRVRLRFEDGNQWVRAQADDTLDVLIVDSTDPVGPAEVLFSDGFLSHCKRVLKPNGILVQQSESPLLHGDSLILPMHETLSQLGMAQIKTLTFPQPIYPSGWWSATLSSKENTLAFEQVGELLKQGGVLPETRYLTPELLVSACHLPKFLTMKD